VTPIHVGEAQGAQGVIAEYRRIARELSELREHRPELALLITESSPRCLTRLQTGRCKSNAVKF
jgi:hypothetical protein